MPLEPDFFKKLESDHIDIKNTTWVRRGQGGITGYECYTISVKINKSGEKNLGQFFGGITGTEVPADHLENLKDITQLSLLSELHRYLLEFAKDGTVKKVRLEDYAPPTLLKFEAKGEFSRKLNEIALAKQGQKLEGASRG